MPQLSDERRMSRKEAAAFLTARGFTTSHGTLHNLAWKGGGPAFEKFGRRPLYTESGLLAWVAVRTGQPQLNTSADLSHAV